MSLKIKDKILIKKVGKKNVKAPTTIPNKIYKNNKESSIRNKTIKVNFNI